MRTVIQFSLYPNRRYFERHGQLATMDQQLHLFDGFLYGQATPVRRILPSSASVFKPLQFVTVSFPSYFYRCFNFLQNACESMLSVKPYLRE